MPSWCKSDASYIYISSLELSRRMTIRNVAAHLNVSWDVIKEIQKRRPVAAVRQAQAQAPAADRRSRDRRRLPRARRLSSGDTIPNRLVVIRSIFSTCNALCQGGLLTLLDVPPSVCYPSGRRWQRRGPKPGGQRNLDPRIGRERASRHGDCQHHGGRGPAVRDRSTQMQC